MRRAGAAEQTEALRREIWEHRKRYYVDNDPVLTDGEYDALERELQELEERFPELVTPDSPTQRVGAEVSGGLPTVRHAVPMLSLDNVITSEELRAWHDRLLRVLGRGAPDPETGAPEPPPVPLVAELKIDGVSISLLFEAGRLVRAVTRGDGIQGEDVTSTVRTIPTVPLRLLRPIPFLEARGEVYYPRPAFEEMNRQREEAGEPVFANPRNAAAGTLRLLDPRLAARRPLSAFVWALVRIEGHALPTTHSKRMRLLGDLGLPINPVTRRCRDLDEVESFHAGWRDRRDTLEYEVDGTVVKVDPVELQDEAGETARAPRWACAYKFPPLQATTTVKEIQIQVGRTGALTPVAILEPVRLAGTTISRCTLHNEEEVRRKDVRVADRVLIERGGDVIPKVVKVLGEAGRARGEVFSMPRCCPACSAEVVRPEGEAIHRCVNLSCPARLKESILHFARREAMDIEGLGEALVDQLLSRGQVRSIADIYHLETDTLAGFDRMGDRSAQNLVTQIERSCAASLERVIFALGIRFVGERTARLLADAFPSMQALLSATREDLMRVHDVGEGVADAIRQFFDRPENRSLVRHLQEAGLTMKPVKRPTASTGPWAGKTVVVTGTIPGHTRGRIKRIVLAGGGHVTETLSKKTDALICGEGPGAKLDRAHTLGIRVIDSKEFLNLLDDGGRRHE